MDEAAAGVFVPAKQPAAEDPPVVGPPAGMVAVAVADLVASGRGEPGGAVVTAGDAAMSGQAMVFCAPVVTTAAVLRRDGRVQADGWLPDHVRLGILEQHLGEGVIERLVA